MIEDVCGVDLSTTARHSHGLIGAEKGLGFVRVAGFIVWFGPAYLCAIMLRANTGVDDSVVPYSFFSTKEE
ncbi:hypothetical protein K469DRAFT_721888 [Zopfia rhizophila CBS 207.26]|uniref:Uncharacterized protein n=1 Tax=Zopfia rhizophila CBS 207.26 TaxID=1314779 RepID=A0A6A6DCM7_9PEZI|nr:hypothetical protein K469DRAFT_721888 [Zopfia rhizophila CBS 207.26]